MIWSHSYFFFPSWLSLSLWKLWSKNDQVALIITVLNHQRLAFTAPCHGSAEKLVPSTHLSRTTLRLSVKAWQELLRHSAYPQTSEWPLWHRWNGFCSDLHRRLRQPPDILETAVITDGGVGLYSFLQRLLTLGDDRCDFIPSASVRYRLLFHPLV